MESGPVLDTYLLLLLYSLACLETASPVGRLVGFQSPPPQTLGEWRNFFEEFDNLGTLGFGEFLSGKKMCTKVHKKSSEMSHFKVLKKIYGMDTSNSPDLEQGGAILGSINSLIFLSQDIYNLKRETAERRVGVCPLGIANGKRCGWGGGQVNKMPCKQVEMQGVEEAGKAHKYMRQWRDGKLCQEALGGTVKSNRNLENCKENHT